MYKKKSIFKKASFLHIEVIVILILLFVFTSMTNVTKAALGDIVDVIPGPGISQQGLTWDGLHLWIDDSYSNKIFKINPSDGSVINSYDSPGDNPRGLAWDGNFLWSSDTGTKKIYKLNPLDCSVIDSFNSPGDYPRDLCWDGTYLWNANAHNSKIYKLDPSDGSILYSFNSPTSSPLGLAWDGLKLWSSSRYSNKIYAHDPLDGSVIISFDRPSDSTCGLAWDGNYLWNVNESDDNIFKIDVGEYAGNQPPNTPSQAPAGPTSVYVDRTFLYSISTIDPNGDQIRYCFYYEIHTTPFPIAYQDWTEWVDSGEIASIAIGFDYIGTFQLKVIAQDIHGANSASSSPLEITVLPDGDDDEDSLLNSWETYGCDVNDDGLCDVDLPAMGADPQHKDIFIEVDWMEITGSTGHSHRPADASIRTVVDSFDNAPVDNPDGTTGIHLHVDYGPNSPLIWGSSDPSATWGNAGLNEGNALDHVNSLGERVDGVYRWSGSTSGVTYFHGLKFMNFNNNRKDIFHYCIFCHYLAGSSSSGISRNDGTSIATFREGASDFIVSLGIAGVNFEAGTFMHELGHNLGLTHGGTNHMNYKPNYLSIMRYGFQFPGLRINGADGHFDYSRFVLPTLNENALNEPTGLSGVPAAGNYGTRFYDPSGNEQIINNINSPIDWNWDGDTTDASVAVNINHDFDTSGNAIMTTDMESYDDWAHIVFDGGSIGAGTFGEELPAEIELVCLTSEDAENMIVDYSVMIEGPGFVNHLTGYSQTYAYTISNNGILNDTYDIEITNQKNWANISDVPTSVSIPSKSSEIFLIPVSIPSDTPVGDEAWLDITVTSTANPLIVDSIETHTVVIDGTAPTTIKTIWSPKYGANDEFVTSSTEFNFTAIDDIVSDIEGIYYRIWFNNTWEPAIGMGTGLLNNFMEYTGNFTLFGEGKHYIEYYSIDNTGILEDLHNQTHVVDDTPPSIIVEVPELGETLQGVVTFESWIIDSTGVDSVKYSIRESGGAQGTIIDSMYESLVASPTADNRWSLLFDTAQLPDGYYVLYVNTSDLLGNEGNTTLNFSIGPWIVRYNGPEDGNDFVNAFALDSSRGNIYVTGYSMNISTDFDYTTVAYDASGLELWMQTYNGPANSSDQAQDIAVDEVTGKVYVTGWITGIGTGTDYATIAYDASGNELWVNTYNDPVKNGDDVAVDIVVDQTTGHIFVTGYCVHPHTWDYTTLAYDAEGNLLWEAIYGYPGPFNDYATAITIDPPSGYVYVTGYSQGSGTPPDYATVVYNISSGAELWSHRYGGPANGPDRARGIAVDPLSGNVYVTGFISSSGTGKDYATVAYDSNGVELWNRSYNGPGNEDDIPYKVLVDSSIGNVYVTGQSIGSDTNYDYATIAYDSGGNELWVKRYNGPGDLDDVAFDIALNSYGEIIVTGGGRSVTTNSDYTTIAYNPEGVEQWFFRYDGPSNYYDMAWAVLVDSDDNVYVTGRSIGNATGYDYATLKYDPSYFTLNPFGVVRNINKDKLYAKIQEGVTDADSGDTLVVGEGVYHENVVIDKPLRLMGENSNAILQGFGADSGVLVDYTHDVIIQHLTIQGYTNGIYLRQSHNNSIENITLFNNNYGIALGDALNNRIIDCTTYNNIVGIFLWGASNNIITCCSSYNNSNNGMTVRTSSNRNTITYCTVFNNTKSGIYITSSYYNDVNNCIAYHNQQGIYLMVDSCNNTITSSVVYDNINEGIRIGASSNNNTVVGCTAHHNDLGLYIKDFNSRNLISDFVAYNNKYGIRLWGSTHNNTIQHCTIYDNIDGIYLTDSPNNTITDCTIYNGINSIVVFTNSPNNIIKNCTVYNNTNGIRLWPLSHNCIVINCIISNNYYYGIRMQDSAYHKIINCTTNHNTIVGINVGDSSNNNTITNCTSYNSKYGIYLGNSLNNMITNCIVQYNENGIYMIHSSQNSISNNVLDHNLQKGIYLLHSHYNSIINCSVTHQNLSTWIGQGISLAYSEYNIVNYNTVSENEYGVLLSYSNYNEISHNLILNNYYGIYLSHSNNTTLLNNTLLYNVYGIVDPFSEYNTLRNNLLNNNEYGIYVMDSGFNIISDNSVSGNIYGIFLNNTMNCVIENNTLSGDQYDIFLSFSDYNNISNNLIIRNMHGIYLYSSYNNTIVNNTVEDKDYAIYVMDSGFNIISDNSVSGNIYGIFLNNTMNCVIENNTLSGDQYDIFLSFSDYNNISNNFIIRNMHGIYLYYSNNNTILYNTVEDKDYAIVDPFSHYNTISNNLIHNNVYGISVEDSQHNTISDNSISENVYGISIDEDSTDNLIYYNNFIENDLQAEDNGDNTWDDGSGTGNFWNDYTGDDLDGDGIGDTSYQDLDHYPIIHPPSNAPPIADADGPYFGAVGEEIIFNASDSYDYNDNDTLQYRWDFDNDGDWDTNWSFDPIATYAWDDEYSGIVVVEVTDTEYTDNDSTTITVRIVEATIVFDPETLNLISQGNPVTVYIELPEDYDVHDINISTILLNGVIPAEISPWEIDDEDEDGIPDLMIKFNRSSVQAILKVGESESIVITGTFNDGILFGGDDRIRTIKE